ncbi:YceI family protein [Pontimicrobium aquaticum]|uniref:YceI-like domain-containing protein n=1 Tax=Pontimicrobium aquaticum TaxID=2565367 RepID=A0A4U0EW00_9FLAO|nr:YceI family protein [Pontimicrobium aquaticum]TJY36000.1 hypothetical protein E5167_09055 [Pontimicrobium aquaticum]
MKNLKLVALSFLLIAVLACKESKKNDATKTQEAQTSENTFSLVKDSTKVKFTAYKTTDKIAIGGEFKKVNITNIGNGETALEALNGAKFSIPVSSLFTNDITNTRDPKILEFFFNVMNDPEFISGVFKVADNNTCSIDVTLNGNTETIPLTYTASSDTNLSFDGVMHLEKWDAMEALASLHKACELLHTGEDGVSKTWSEVALHVDILLKRL